MSTEIAECGMCHLTLPVNTWCMDSQADDGAYAVCAECDD